jgi:hypothetical protein
MIRSTSELAQFAKDAAIKFLRKAKGPDCSEPENPVIVHL